VRARGTGQLATGAELGRDWGGTGVVSTVRTLAPMGRK